jgi:hypothetical protein
MSTHDQTGSLYARDIRDEWACATETPYERGVHYYCDCPDKHRMKLVKASGNPDKRHFRDYFSHNTSGHKRDADGNAITCKSGGESDEHKNAKHKLREMVGKFTYVTKQCKKCKAETIEDGHDASIILEMQSNDMLWRYDCMLVRDNKSIAALEIFHKHATTDDKISATRLDGIQIAEFRAEDVNDMQDGMLLRNLSPVIFTCHRCLLQASKTWILQCYNEERNELRYKETQIANEYLIKYQEEVCRQNRKIQQRQEEEKQRLRDEAVLLNAKRHKHNEETLQRQRQLKLDSHFEANYFSKTFSSRFCPPPNNSEHYTPYQMVSSEKHPRVRGLPGSS